LPVTSSAFSFSSCCFLPAVSRFPAPLSSAPSPSLKNSRPDDTLSIRVGFFKPGGEVSIHFLPSLPLREKRLDLTSLEGAPSVRVGFLKPGGEVSIHCSPPLPLREKTVDLTITCPVA